MTDEQKQTPERERRLKIIVFDERFLVDVLNWWRNPPAWLAIPVTDALPSDCVVLAVHWSPGRACFEALVTSDSFHAVPVGQMIERIDPDVIHLKDMRNVPFVDNYVKEIERLRSELERLKRGEFTEPEFQNLCHNLNEDDACRFRAGCEEYQRKLFGDKSGGDDQILSGSYVDQVGSISRLLASDNDADTWNPNGGNCDNQNRGGGGFGEKPESLVIQTKFRRCTTL